MEIHKPKAWHGWREFLKEYAIIVLGVLTALAADSVAEAIHERHAASEARSAIYNEVRQNLSYMRGRLDTQSCVEHRLNEIGAIISKAQDRPMSPHPSWIGQPSIWTMATQRWQAATGSGRASLFDSEDQQRLADVYVLFAQFADAEAGEQAAWAQLRGLETWTGPLGSAGRIHFLSALQDARYELWNTRTNIELALIRGRALGIDVPKPGKMVAGYALPHAVCLPIDTPRAVALAQLAGDSPGWGQPQ